VRPSQAQVDDPPRRVRPIMSSRPVSETLRFLIRREIASPAKIGRRAFAGILTRPVTAAAATAAVGWDVSETSCGHASANSCRY
jgi:hypothetical protein